MAQFRTAPGATIDTSSGIRPEDLEMPLSGFADYITPIERFFVRTHVPAPRVDLTDWRLKVDGAVATPLTLTMEDVRRLPALELVSVLECAGNGRGFYEPSMPGLQWANGAVGNGRWRGVRLADVLRRAGLKESAKEVLFNGADVPPGTIRPGMESLRLWLERHTARASERGDGVVRHSPTCTARPCQRRTAHCIQDRVRRVP
jgi:DMSO/TMAO reductase YedYZ molybdopterin-dependent catalytic subunit